MKLDLAKEYPYFVPIIESVGTSINNINQSDFKHQSDAEILEEYWKNLSIGTKFKNEDGKTTAIVIRHEWIGIVDVAFLFPKKLTWKTAIKKLDAFDDEIFPLLPNALKNINPELFHWDVDFITVYEHRELTDIRNNVLKLFDIKIRKDMFETNYWLSAAGVHDRFGKRPTTHNPFFGESQNTYNRCVYFLHLRKNQ